MIVYELTPYGRELEPLVLGLSAWGFKAMGDPREEQILTPDAMTIALRTAFRPDAAATLPSTSYAGGFGAAQLLVRVDGPSLDVSRGSGPADLAFDVGTGTRTLLAGDLETVRVLSGDPRLLDRFAATFHLVA